MLEKTSKKAPDGVQMAMISSRVETIARKMQNTLFRDRPLRNPEHGPRFLMRRVDCRLQAACRGREPAQPHPYRPGPDVPGRPQASPGSEARRLLPAQQPRMRGIPHAADHCMIVPVIDDEGILRFFVLAKAHQADCGNSRPSSYLADVKDLYEEGALIFSATKIQEHYETNHDIVRMCQARIPRAGAMVRGTSWQASDRSASVSASY